MITIREVVQRSLEAITRAADANTLDPPPADRREVGRRGWNTRQARLAAQEKGTKAAKKSRSTAM